MISKYNEPIDNYEAIKHWQHNNCSDDCIIHFGHICPNSYYNVVAQQNFGWRYMYNSKYSRNELEFHQGVDISKPVQDKVTDAKNIFRGNAYVEKSSYNDSVGNYVQLSYDKLYYATYMHLHSRAVSEYKYITTGAVIGKVGNTGYSTAPHLHLSVAYKTNVLYPSTAKEKKKFVDPAILMP